VFLGRQVYEEQSTYDELFTEQQFEEEPNKEYYDEYSVNPVLAFPRPMVKYNSWCSIFYVKY